MKRKISFGKIDYLSNGKKTCPVTVDVELKASTNGPVLSIRGWIYNHIRTDIYTGGQCLDTIAEYITTPLFKEIYRFWKLYHLNDMHAGTPEQEKAVKKWSAKENCYDYTEICNYLKSINLYEVNYQGKPYKYGHGWLYEPIPENDLTRIKEIIEKGE